MPDRAIHKIMTATEPADVAQMAVIECLRQIADANKKTGQVLEGMQTELRDVRERVIRIEASEFKAEVQQTKAEIAEARALVNTEIAELEARVVVLEVDKNRRDGAISGWEYLLKSWPALVGFVAVIVVVLLANGKLSL
jgi:hypothetical protein